MAISLFDACTIFGPWPQHSDFELPELLAVMEFGNITRALTLSSTGIFYDHRAGNAATLEACRAHSDKLVPVATLDPRAYPAALDEAERVADAGFKQIRFFPGRQGWPISFLPFRELLQKCDALKLTVAVEITHPGDATELADAVAFTQAPLLLAGVRSPNLGEALAVLRSSAKFHIETTHLSAPGALESVVKHVPNGHERLIFASYAPLRYLSSSLSVVGASSLSAEHKAAAAGGNLNRLLK